MNDAYEQALRWLAQREFAAADLEKRLARKGHDKQAISDALAELIAVDLQSDARYAEIKVRSDFQRGRGSYGLARHFDELEIDPAFYQHHLDEYDWALLARETAVKKVGEVTDLDWPSRQKLGRFLNQRGFEHDHIRSVIDPFGD